jgi:branched-chain amino acid transport system substrate-binding protein
MKKYKRTLLAFIMLLVSVLAGQSLHAAEYNVSSTLDFTGPFAVVMKASDQAAQAYFAWWNEEVGKKLGVKVNRVVKDSRYDPAVVASLWPGVLSSLKPIAHMGMGGPDVAALMRRLPKDKVPMTMSTGTYGFIWLPNQWVFQTRPTYVQEAAGFLNWAHENLIKDRPIKVATISTKVSPAFTDGVDGIKAFCEATPWLEFVGVEWVKMKPTSLVSEMRRLAKKKPDFIWLMTAPFHSVGAIKAEKQLGIHIPLILTSHNGIQMSARASKDINLLEGHYDVVAVDPGLKKDIPAAEIYDIYTKKLGFKNEWGVMTSQSALQSMLTLRAIERAINKVGKDNLTGEAVYEALLDGPFTEESLLGLTHTQSYTKAAPFSTEDIKVKVTTVKDGKQVSVSEDWLSVPPMDNWSRKKPGKK